MKKYYLVLFLTIIVLGLVNNKTASACSVIYQEVHVPTTPKLEGWITYQENQYSTFSNKQDYYAIAWGSKNPCGVNKFYINKNFVYTSVSFIGLFLGTFSIFIFRKKNHSPKQ